MTTIQKIQILAFFILWLSGNFCPPYQLMAQTNAQQQQLNQRFADENLAYEFYRNQDWENAKALYLKLFDAYKAQHYFNFYLNCLFNLNQLDEAERAIRRQMRSGGDVQSEIDLGYLQQLRGDRRKASETFDRIIRQMPADRNWINTVANAFRTRNLDEYALLAYENGSTLPGINYGFHLEKASLYQMTGNFGAATDQYLDFLLIQPEQMELTKNRLQGMMMMDIDNSMADLIRGKLLQRAQSQPSQPLFGELLIWFSLQQKEYDIAMIQAIALDRRLGDREHTLLDLAWIAMSNNQYEVASSGFNYIIGKGSRGLYYSQGLIGSIQSRYYLAEQNQTGDSRTYDQLLRDIAQAFDLIGFNRETAELAMIKASILTHVFGKFDEAFALMERTLQLPLRPDEQARLKMHSADLLLFQDEVWEATLLYSQVDKAMKNEPVAHEARFRNARLRYFIGEFNWAQTQLDILKAATSKLIANDALTLTLLIHDNLMDDTTGNSLRAFARADLRSFQKRDKDALNTLDSLSRFDRNQALRPHILMKKAEILTRSQDFVVADSLYAQVYLQSADHYLADDALFKAAMLNEYQLSNPAKARQLYEILFEKYPASIYASQSRQKYRLLRSDAT